MGGSDVLLVIALELILFADRGCRGRRKAAFSSEGRLARVVDDAVGRGWFLGDIRKLRLSSLGRVRLVVPTGRDVALPVVFICSVPTEDPKGLRG